MPARSKPGRPELKDHSKWMKSEGLIYVPPKKPTRQRQKKSLPGQQRLFDEGDDAETLKEH